MDKIPVDIVRNIYKYNHRYAQKGVFMLYTRRDEPERYIDIVDVDDFFIYAKIQYEKTIKKYNINFDLQILEWSRQPRGFYIEINENKYYFDRGQVKRYQHFDIFIRLHTTNRSVLITGNSEFDTDLLEDIRTFHRHHRKITKGDLKVYVDYTNNKTVHKYETERMRNELFLKIYFLKNIGEKINT